MPPVVPTGEGSTMRREVTMSLVGVGVLSALLLGTLGSLQLSDVRQENKQLRKELTAMQGRVDTLSKAADSSEVTKQVTALDGRLKTVEDRQGKAKEELSDLAKSVAGYGVCVEREEGTETNWVTWITSADVINGAKQCLDGSFVSVVPEVAPEGRVP